MAMTSAKMSITTAVSAGGIANGVGWKDGIIWRTSFYCAAADMQ